MGTALNVRFLIATKEDMPATITRIEKCLVWRRTERVDDVEPFAERCSPEVSCPTSHLAADNQSATGKNILLSFSNKGFPVLYFFPHRNTTPLEQRSPIHAVSRRADSPIFCLIADLHARASY